MKIHRINALLLKYYYITINRVDRLFDVFYWPVIDLLVWGFASFYIEKLAEVNILSMLMGGIILWVFVWRASQDIAVFVLEDFWSRNLYHLFSSPVKLSEHLVSIILLGLLRSLATFIIMSLFAWLFYSFNIFKISPIILAACALLLTLFGWAMGLLVTSFIFRFGQRIQVLAWSVVFIIQPFACIFYPLSSLPNWASKIASILPPTYAFEALRASISGNNINYPGLFYSLIADLALLGIAAVFIKSSFEKAKRTGLLAKGD